MSLVKTQSDNNIQHRIMADYLVLNGVDNYLSSSFDFSNYFWYDKQFTLSFWFKFVSNNLTNRSYQFQVSRTLNPAYQPGYPTSRRRFYVTLDAGEFATIEFESSDIISITDSWRVSSRGRINQSWNHICVVHDGNPTYEFTKIYVNGYTDMQNPIGVLNDVIPPTFEELPVLHNAWIGTDWSGSITGMGTTDVLLSSALATKEEVRTLFNYGRNRNYSKYPVNIINNLISHWPLTESTTSGVIFNDIASNRNFQLVGSPAIFTGFNPL